jgi:hypothetical protein
MNHRSTALLTAAFSALGMLVSGTACAGQELDLRAGFGYDSNAFDLNQTIGERAGAYAQLEAAFLAEGIASTGWTKAAEVGASAQMFESGMTDGDEEKYFVRVRGSSNEKRDEHGWEWSLQARMHDMTYVSRLTGVVATDSLGNEISDRFNNLKGDFQATWHFPGGKFGRISVEGTAAYKNYLTDYEELGLDRLDYEEFGITPVYDIGGSNRNLRIGLTYSQRQYRDRRVSDAAGNPVAGTDLEYRYYGVDARFRQELTRKSVLEMTGGYDMREDNGVGFADRTRWNAGIEWTYRPASETRLVIDFEWNSRVFDNQVTGDPTINDEVPDKQGYEFKVRYTTPFPGLKSRGYLLYAEAGSESYDNSNDVRYAYDRTVAFIGIRKIF